MKIYTERFGLPEEKKKNYNGLIIFFMILLVIIAIFVALKVENIIRNNIQQIKVDEKFELNSTWIGSVASYWGGVIGGIISGVLGCAGVFCTIKYYKESDSQKERASVQPFIRATREADRDPDKLIEYKYENYDEGETLCQCPIQIKNIGNGFATIINIYTNKNSGGQIFNQVLDEGDHFSFNILAKNENIKEGMTFYLMYIDSMRNEYVQKYNYVRNDGVIQIESGYPMFLKMYK